MDSSKNLQKILELVTLGCLIIVTGIIYSFINNNNVNEISEETVENTYENNFTLTPEKILASYSVKTVTASDEVVSRSARIREEANCVSIDEISISKDMDLTQSCNISRDSFIELMSNVKYDTSGFFEENAGLIYDICKKYELNEIFFCGLISAESGWNIASNHRRTYNYISLMSSNGGLIKFSSVEEGLEKAASTLHNKYLTEGGSFYYGKTLEKVRTRFCPVNPGWTSLVYGRMQQILE